jgi:transposase
MSVSYVARKYGIAPSLLFRWRKLMSEGGKEAIRSDDAVVSAAEVRELKRIRELERVLGKKTLENEILTEAVKLPQPITNRILSVLIGATPGIALINK